MGNDAGKSLFPVGKMLVDEDSNFVVGDSPHVISSGGLTISDYLTHNGNRGYIKVDGPGDILVEISHSGTNYASQFRLKNGDSVDLTGMAIANMRLTHSGTDSAYRILLY